ncbi:hypothetical protein F2Q69_00027003 [Brassica cretica]|uniref:peptidyl-tRNA hydrolase n=1 Tax=Brassica cretica TaxID=69181 RepID=A0A8S9S196_BRACR|nr:hypothetical protein F2Q69_00027003 [Brassica cretica]
MKAAVFPSKIASLGLPSGHRCALFFRSPPALPSSFSTTPCRKLARGIRGSEGFMSQSSSSSQLFSSLSNSFSSQSESELPQVQLPSPKPKSPPPQLPWLIVGLGNPGKKYQGTRHNVGFEMVDALAEAEGISMNTVNFKALFGKGVIGNIPIMLAKPQTFMNASGESVGQIVSFYKIPLKQVLVIYDDLDLPFGKLRLLPKGVIGNIPIMLAKPQTFMNASGESVGQIVSFYKIPLKQVLVIYDDLDLPFGKLRLLPKGGHGGHNGMRSIIDRLKGSRNFPRLRIGIGRPPGKMDTANYVLRPFNKQEQEELDYTFQTGLEAIRIMLLEGFNKSATFVNTQKSMQQLRIGRPPGKMDTANYVLRPFNKQEQEELDYTFQTGLEAIRIMLLEGFNKSATFVNTQKSMQQLS